MNSRANNAHSINFSVSIEATLLTGDIADLHVLAGHAPAEVPYKPRHFRKNYFNTNLLTSSWEGKMWLGAGHTTPRLNTPLIRFHTNDFRNHRSQSNNTKQRLLDLWCDLGQGISPYLRRVIQHRARDTSRVPEDGPSTITSSDIYMGGGPNAKALHTQRI